MWNWMKSGVKKVKKNIFKKISDELWKNLTSKANSIWIYRRSLMEANEILAWEIN